MRHNEQRAISRRRLGGGYRRCFCDVGWRFRRALVSCVTTSQRRDTVLAVLDDLGVAAEQVGPPRSDELLTLAYRDAEGTETRRVVLPLALIYYDEAVNLVAWCEMRQAIRHFRTERVLDAQASGTSFRGRGEGLRRQWQAGWTGTT